MRRSVFVIAAALALAAPVAAQSPLLAQAIEAGQIGERYDGYMGTVGEAPPAVDWCRGSRCRRKMPLQVAPSVFVTVEKAGWAS